MDQAVEALKRHATENAYLDVQGQYKVTAQDQTVSVNSSSDNMSQGVPVFVCKVASH